MLWTRAAFLLAVLCASAPVAAAPAIEWRLENPFRFFTKPSDTEMHRASFLALGEAEALTPVLSVERALSERFHGEGWAAAVIDATCWEPERNRHVCRGRNDYINPRSHRIIASARGIAEAGIDCTWLTAPKAARLRGQSVTVPCDTAVILDIPYPAGARVTLEVGNVEIAQADVVIEDVFVVGIGDSFGSGEGNPDVPVRFSRERYVDYGRGERSTEYLGYPARVGNWREVGDKAFIESNPRWLDQACHRSLYSHQLRAALQLAIENPKRAVTYVGYACSGAEIVDGLFLRYKGHEWVPNPPDLSQISAVAQAQCDGRPAHDFDLPEAYHIGGRVPALKGGLVLRKCDPEHARKIDLILVSIGGNDVGFSRLVANAVLADQSVLRRVGGWFGQVHGFVEAAAQLDELDDRYKALNRALHNILHIPWSEADRVLLVSYPPLTLLEDGRTVCPNGRAGMTVASDFALSAEKAKDSMVAAERLDGIMQEASRQHGWTLVAGHRKAFIGRSICAGWVDNALSSADDLRLPRWTGSEWVPLNPADWRAYVPRQRWFRTPNDAFMTGNFHVARSIMQKALPSNTISWFQVLLASLYSGAFHPTAEGQAAMADAVVTEARRVLAKYEGRRRGR
jgi:hypothetical protein